MLNRTEDSKRTHLENVERLIRAAHSNTISVVQVGFRIMMLLLGGILIVKLGLAKPVVNFGAMLDNRRLCKHWM